MATKFKLLKDIPDAKAGTIFTRSSNSSEHYSYIDKEGYQDFYDVYKVESNPDWFAIYLFTTEDGVEIFSDKTEVAWVINNEFAYMATIEDNDGKLLNCLKVNLANNTYKIFSTKEKAQEYLDSLVEFKVGDIVVDIKAEFIDKIISITDNCVVHFKTNPPQGFKYIRKATPDEIIQYYEQQGWVKGAKFRCKDGIKTLCKEDTVYVGLYGDVIVNSTEYKQYQIKDCELVKEPTLPAGGFGYMENGEIIIP